MKYSFISVFIGFLLSGLITSCVDVSEIDLSKPGKKNQPKNNNNQVDIVDKKNPKNNNNQAVIDTIRIDSHVLTAIKEQIASQAPMRGGDLFGDIHNNEVNIKYFLYDYASKHSSGSYTKGDNLLRNSLIARSSTDENDQHPFSLMVGHAHSMPGTMNYVMGNYEENLELFLRGYPQNNANAYVLLLITIGVETMRNIEPNELKLDDTAKVSFFVKERGQGQHIKKITLITTYSSDVSAYKRMHSFIDARAHFFDVQKKIHLVNHGEPKSFDELFELEKGITMTKDLGGYIFFKKFPDRQKMIKLVVDFSYPKTPPTLVCSTLDAQGMPASIEKQEKAGNWLSDEKNPKNFEEFYEDFITTKCLIR